ncbi:DNA damage-binding protein 1a, partial [Rhizophlyctis rosea]
VGEGLQDTLVMSFVGETRFAKIDPEEGAVVPLEDVVEGGIVGFESDETTLAIGNVVGCGGVGVLQVTPSAAILVTLEGYMKVAEWRPEEGKKIMQGSVNEEQAVVSLGGGWVVYLEVKGESVVEVSRKQMPHEISCLNISRFGGEDGRGRSEWIVVGLWTDVSVRVLRVGTLEEVEVVELGGEIIPRSALMVRIDGVDYVMAALGDGTLYNFAFDPTTGKLSDMKKVALGTQPITLSTFKSDGKTHVFASSDRPTVIYGRAGKLVYSNVNLKDVTHATSFNFTPDTNTATLAFATEGSIKIGTVEAANQRLHVGKIRIGETCRRICWARGGRCFGVLTYRDRREEDLDARMGEGGQGQGVDGESDMGRERWEWEGEEVGEEHFLRVLDEKGFDVLDSYRFKPTENIESIICVSIPADSKKSGRMVEVFVVGTAYVRPTEDEPKEGRVVAFEVGREDRKLRLLTEVGVKGSAYCLCECEGRVLVGVNGRIEMFEWTYGSDGSTPTLTPSTTYIGNITTVTLASRGDFILSGDFMKSVSLLRLHSPPSDQQQLQQPQPQHNKLELIARDTEPIFVTQAEFVDDDNYLVTDGLYNFCVVGRRSESGVEEDGGGAIGGVGVTNTRRPLSSSSQPVPRSTSRTSNPQHSNTISRASSPQPDRRPRDFTFEHPPAYEEVAQA